MSELEKLGLKALAVLVLLAFVAGFSYQKGKHAGDAERTELALERERELGRAVTSAVAQGNEAAAQLAAQRRITAAERRSWMEKLNATNDRTLVEPPPTCIPGDADTAAAAGPGLRLSGDFLGLYNDGWCRAAGDAVSAAACRAAAAAAGAAAVEPRRILAHGEAEAAACGEDRKRLNQLLDLLSRPPWTPASTP